MTIRNLPWHKFGSVEAWSGTIPSLQEYFGPAWPLIRGYFRLTPDLADAIDCPSPGGSNCPRRIVEHAFDDLVAVCGNYPAECETIPVAREDVMIHALKFDTLVADLGRLLAVRGAAPERILHLTWRLGSFSMPGRPALPVLLCLETDPDTLRLAALDLLDRQGTPCALLIPSLHRCPASLPSLLEGRQIWLVPLEELAATSEADAALFLARYLPEAALPPLPEPENCFRLEHDYWKVRFRGESYTIKDSKGMTYIAHLISRAYDNEPEILSQQLYYLVNGFPVAEQGSEYERLTAEEQKQRGISYQGQPGPGLEVMTPDGRKHAKILLLEYEQKIDEAEGRGDPEEVLSLREEKEQLKEYLANSKGLAGRERKVHDDHEKARQAVEGAIRRTLQSMEKKGNPLAVYLDQHLKKGLYCSFIRDPDVEWQVF